MTIINFGTQQPASQSRATTRLRQMLQSGTMVAAPFVLNAFHAQIAARLDFQAVYMTGFGTAAERGYPDVGLVTQTEMGVALKLTPPRLAKRPSEQRSVPEGDRACAPR